MSGIPSAPSAGSARSLPRRRSIRLRGFDYAQVGLYFVTICAKDRVCLFGEISGGRMIANELGAIVGEEWSKTAKARPEVVMPEDDWVLMPNHLHGIIWIQKRRSEVAGEPTQQVQAGSLGAVVRAFKAAVTQRIHGMRPDLSGPVWQRNYHDHIIRSSESLRRLREYMRNNPARWEMDQLHPAAPPDKWF